MAHKRTSVIFLIVFVSFTCAQMDRNTTTTTTTQPPQTTQAPPQTTTTTQESAQTTTPVLSPLQTTTTTQPPQTTQAPPQTTTTTSAPTTPTAAPIISTTIAPSPEPVQPDHTKWSYPTDKKETCVIVELAVQINLTYQNLDDKSTNVLYNVPVNGTNMTSGTCGKVKQSITVQWGQKSGMMLEFTKINSQFMLSQMNLTINASDVSEKAKDNQTIQLYHKKDEFATSVATSYRCNKTQTIGFTSTENGTDVVANATISHVQLEAFHEPLTDEFSTARDCEPVTPVKPVKPSDNVGVAVGCSLAGIVIVALIVYVLIRKRAQIRGYLNV